MKHVIHIHQSRIRQNLSAIIDRTYKKREGVYHRHLDIRCPSCGTVAASVVQTEEPDRCGARVTIQALETEVVQ